MAKIHVWYKMSGEIVAFGHAVGKSKCLPVSAENQSVLEADIDESQISSLHQTHMVDPLQKVVVKMQHK